MEHIACIAIDWGTTNRRAWALDCAGAVIASRADDQGLIAISDRDFAGSLRQYVSGWLNGRPPVIMAGMVGSRLGWKEAPYLEIPVVLDTLASHLVAIDFDGIPIRIVPGIAKVTAGDADVMRGEECQMLGALLVQGRRDGIFLLPGTHSKWVLSENGALTDFRTYMTGELFGHLRKSGSLSQVMPPNDLPDSFHADSFDRGVERALAADAAALSHLLFGVRSLSLFGQLQPAQAPSYLSGLLVGAEMKDALHWLPATKRVNAIGSGKLLESYARAASRCGIALDQFESDTILPPALFAIACKAGLLTATATDVAGDCR